MFIPVVFHSEYVSHAFDLRSVQLVAEALPAMFHRAAECVSIRLPNYLAPSATGKQQHTRVISFKYTEQ